MTQVNCRVHLGKCCQGQHCFEPSVEYLHRSDVNPLTCLLAPVKYRETLRGRTKSLEQYASLLMEMDTNQHPAAAAGNILPSYLYMECRSKGGGENHQGESFQASNDTIEA